MSITRHVVLLLVAGALAVGAARAADPALGLTEDGSAFVYRARPGDTPSTLAATFGVAPEAVPAFLKANGVTDPTRIATGHVFRIPNPVLPRAEAAEAKAQGLERDLAAASTRVASLEHDLASTRDAAADATERADRLARYAWLWRLAAGLAVLLAIALGLTITIAVGAVRTEQRAEHYARTLADELEEKRRRGLTERQEAQRHILDLEAEVQRLAARREPRPPAPSRRSGAG
jgi:Skp family chaperone for outer membrane proteins